MIMGITSNNIDTIIRWLTSDMEQAEGRRIIAELHPNRRLARNSSHMSVRTVEYELKVLIGIPKTAIFTQKCTNEEIISKYVKRTEDREDIPGRGIHRIGNGGNPQGHRESPAPQGTKKETRPRVSADDHLLLQAKEAVAELGMEASKLHNALFETGEVNGEKNTRLRADMLEQLRIVTDLKEAIWKEKEDYCDTGVASQRLKDMVETYYNKGESGDGGNEDLSAKDTAWLIKRKENVRKYITKCRNRLEYGTKTAQAKKNPMPPGSERAKTQKRLDDYIKELEAITKELERRTDQ